ncbi:cysteine--1-D-myo-inosityl 2-amino-2-deoxy-alpha-D-glucopyranoside ligase [Devriesea agamarum]|uniref:cysteine--1-D-myo-inosityl 2-amino-2-deoxy-alpha-D-glucopyranoside ligase n=1 Tax=Devriesea agamarum TaxID=472569 RepID=UPI000A02B1A9|nr:cysteine--1-D-myo-inosityl 2-amino-2-deoxy-alpha-D-glucopyranoside ligase [Devriesea agamarum]
MKSWHAPEIPTLPRSTSSSSDQQRARVNLYDARRRGIYEITPLKEGVVRLYTCGITPYDSTHMGHAATYQAADLLHRVLLDAGWAVQSAQNVTDVDDPLLERAEQTGVDWRELAADQSELFATDMEALRIIPPATYLGVEESIDSIIEAVTALVHSGRAYRVPTDDAVGDDLYLDLAQDGQLGAICGWSEEEMMSVFAERGGDPDRSGKRQRFDPLLWRAARDGEPSWDAPVLGAGRPGWHIECVCISRTGLGIPFDIQLGGRDLIFPHHDMSHAHAIALGDRDFATTYAHVGMIGLDGHKMSKSRGNLVFVSQLRSEGVDPAAIRLALLSHHYREDWEWTDETLNRALSRTAAIRHALALTNGHCGPREAQAIKDIRAALRHDLDSPAALRVLDTWAAQVSEHSASLTRRADETTRPERAVGDTGCDMARALDALMGLSL